MRGFFPEGWLVTLHAQRRGGVVLHEKFAVLIVMRIMTGGALELVVVVKTNLLRQRGGIFELAISGDERIVVSEGDGMVVRKIGAEIARALWHGRDVVPHLDGSRATRYHAERHGPVMA